MAIDLKNLPILHAGVDEAGRGPLAGPVAAAAVILNPQQPIVGLADSKLLRASVREQLSHEIKQYALAWAIAYASPQEIDQINILQATLLAMQRAINNLTVTPSLILIDGRDVPANLSVPAEAIIKGDQLVAAISAASILAKVARDELMQNYDRQYPHHEFARHKGYGTARHRALIQLYGICPIHRKSFLRC